MITYHGGGEETVDHDAIVNMARVRKVWSKVGFWEVSFQMRHRLKARQTLVYDDYPRHRRNPILTHVLVPLNIFFFHCFN